MGQIVFAAKVTHIPRMCTSSEFPTQIEALEYDHAGDPALAKALAAKASERGAANLAHDRGTRGWSTGPWCRCTSCSCAAR